MNNRPNYTNDINKCGQELYQYIIDTINTFKKSEAAKIVQQAFKYVPEYIIKKARRSGINNWYLRIPILDMYYGAKKINNSIHIDELKYDCSTDSIIFTYNGRLAGTIPLNEFTVEKLFSKIDKRHNSSKDVLYDIQNVLDDLYLPTSYIKPAIGLCKRNINEINYQLKINGYNIDDIDDYKDLQYIGK